MLKIYNTLTRQLEEVLKDGKNIKVYSCGITVYWRMQLGNLRAYVAWDILHRSLLYMGLNVKRVINFTDVGHMSSDENFGEDKIEKTAIKEGVNPFGIADEYIKTVMEDFSSMNIFSPSGVVASPDTTPEQTKEYGWTRATDYIQEIVDLIKRIEKNGFTYETESALYFDISKFPDYTKMSGQKLSEKLEGAREDVEFDPKKKNPADFVLWMKRVGKYKNHIMHWDSPWGDGFPGWHIECSAMGMKVLGEDIDLHTGGVDHIAIHHSNERAQNFGATGKEVVRIWSHNEFLQSESGDKLSKSKGNASTLPEIIAQGFDPMDVRYFFALTNYRMPMKFSMEALKNSRDARLSLVEKLKVVKEKANGEGKILEEYKKKFIDALSNDLNVAMASAVLYEVLKSTNSSEDILVTVFDFDKVFGFKLAEAISEEVVPNEVKELANKRMEAKTKKDYALSDQLRVQIEKLGYLVSDTLDGYRLKKK